MYRFIKRLFDIVVSFTALLILSPLLLPVMIILLLTGEHYVFYLQPRIGYKNRQFNIIKFATMLKNSPKMGTGSITVKNDPRVLPFGKFLRKTKINEIPQLWNILRGDMSFVGPRPLMEEDFYRYPKHVQQKIYDVTPGLTGVGSVVFRDEEELLGNYPGREVEAYEKLFAPYKGELELWYQQHMSLWMDLKIIISTALVVFFPKSKIPERWFSNAPHFQIKPLE